MQKEDLSQVGRKTKTKEFDTTGRLTIACLRKSLKNNALFISDEELLKIRDKIYDFVYLAFEMRNGKPV